MMDFIWNASAKRDVSAAPLRSDSSQAKFSFDTDSGHSTVTFLGPVRERTHGCQ